jgi:hypothetical protein
MGSAVDAASRPAQPPPDEARLWTVQARAIRNLDAGPIRGHSIRWRLGSVKNLHRRQCRLSSAQVRDVGGCFVVKANNAKCSDDIHSNQKLLTKATVVPVGN